ncbi:MAG: hypothetical protein HOQ09_09210 [Gemmatimonadaceae bacterium]|nr:hypothetical protein [Gemmatimonadaceae bacterium]
MRYLNAVVVCAIALCTVAVADAGAQAKTARPKKDDAPRTIEIHGQLPTPQVVTVRPRAQAEFDRQFMATYFSRHFDHALDAPMVMLNRPLGGVRVEPAPKNSGVATMSPCAHTSTPTAANWGCQVARAPRPRDGG